MAKLFELTDSYQQDLPEEDIALPTDRPRVVINTTEFDNPKKEENLSAGENLKRGIKNLLGLDDENPRYQLWPEKVVREALTSAGDIAKPNPYAEGSEQWYEYERLRQEGMVPAAMAISALAGSGGLGGTGAKAGEVALGATPFLRPALKYKEKLYKGKPGQEHQDIIPKELYEDFRTKAMSGEDLAEYNFGFINDKGHFLDREKALKYGIDTGLIDPHSGKFGALTTTLMADSSKPGTAIEAVAKSNVPTFYSAVEHTVKNIPQSKMTGEQWLGTLTNKPGVKSEELDWTGLKSFLEENKGKPVTKQQIEDHIASNKVELKEVNKGGITERDKIAPDQIAQNKYKSEWDAKVAELRPLREKVDDLERKLSPQEWEKAKNDYFFKSQELDAIHDRMVNETIERMGGLNKPTKYHRNDLVLPGGENYREMLLTLPESNKQYAYDAFNPKTQQSKQFATRKEAENFANKDTSGNTVVSEIEVGKENYKSSHWDEPNILAHVRMNDRNIDGKKSLHLEEIQSDWHQQGRDKGYASSGSLPKFHELNKKFEEARADLGFATEKKANELLGMSYQKYRQMYPAEKETALTKLKEYRNKDPEYVALENKVAELDKARMEANPVGKIPDAPFKKSWHELALKRMLREAAEKGYDRLSWTPGEAQAARYDLSKQVDKIAVPMVNNDGTRSVRIDAKNDTPFRLMIDKNGIVEGAGSGSQFSGKPLSDVVGKEMADKIMKLDKPHEFAGEGLKIGGEGMKGFYDQIIPKALEKLGKEHGVKVKQDFIANKDKEWPFPIRVASDGKKYWLEGKDPRLDHAKDVSLSKKFDSYADADVMRERFYKGETEPIFYIDIPQSLKDTALNRGFPLFSSAYPSFIFLPVQGNPFENEK